MKYLTTITCCLMLLVSGTAFADDAKFTIKAIDESGNTIPGANVRISLPNRTGWGDDGPDKKITYLTDSEGICVAQIEYKGDAGFLVFKDNYYKTSGSIQLKKSSNIFHGWEPWNPTIEVMLKKIGTQIPMYAKREQSKLPGLRIECGYDLTQGDWIAPYGKGETADFIFKVEGSRREEPGTTRFPEVYYNYVITLTFSNPWDGIQPVFAPPRGGSELRLAHEAPESGYENLLKLRICSEKDKSVYENVREDQNYYFRVRTQRDAKGNIISGLYGKISGNIEFGPKYVNFTYYLNPDPVSRGLEWDGKNNLLKNIKHTSLNWPPRN